MNDYLAQLVAAASVHKPRNLKILDKLGRCFRQMVFLVFMTAAQMFFLTGCGVPEHMDAKLPEYPSQMPPLVTGDANGGACPHIAGHYSDKGKVLTPQGKAVGEVSLSQLLHNNDPCFAQADSIVVAGPEQGLLEINSLKNGKPYAAWWVNFPSEGPGQGHICRCEKGFVVIYGVTNKNSSVGITGYGGGSCNLWFKQSVDGSLVALDSTLYGGVIGWIVPYWYARDLWYRFPSVEESVQQHPNHTATQTILHPPGPSR